MTLHTKRPGAWSRVFLLLTLLPLAFILAGCPGGDSGGTIAVPSNVGVRVVNATQLPQIDATIDGKSVGTGVQIGQDTNYMPTHLGQPIPVTVNATGQPNNLLFNQNIQFSTDTSLVFVGPANGVAVFPVQHPARSTTNATIQVLYAGTLTGDFDAYVLTPTQDINTATPINGNTAINTGERGANNQAFNQSFTPGTYTVVFTQRGSKTPVASVGPFDARANKRYLAVVENNAANSALTAMLIGESAHPNTGGVQFFNATTDAQNANLDAFVGTLPIGNNTGQGQGTGFVAVGGTTSTVAVQRTSNHQGLFSNNFTFSNSTRVALVALDARSPNSLDLATVTYPVNQNIAFGDADVAIVNGVNTPSNADFYIVAPGTNINGVQPTQGAVPYAGSFQKVVNAGQYQIVATQPGAPNNVLATANVTLDPGDYLLLVLVQATGQQASFEGFNAATSKRRVRVVNSKANRPPAMAGHLVR
jgi:hypothetical protein